MRFLCEIKLDPDQMCASEGDSLRFALARLVDRIAPMDLTPDQLADKQFPIRDRLDGYIGFWQIETDAERLRKATIG